MSGMSRRRFIVHSAHKTIGVSAGLAALEAGDRDGVSVLENLDGDLAERFDEIAGNLFDKG